MRGQPTEGTKPELYQRLRDAMVKERMGMLGDAQAAVDGRNAAQLAQVPEEGYTPTEEELALLEEPLPADLFKLSVPVVRRQVFRARRVCGRLHPAVCWTAAKLPAGPCGLGSALGVEVAKSWPALEAGPGTRQPQHLEPAKTPRDSGHA